MRKLTFALLILALPCLPSVARAERDVSVGLALSMPEIAGLYVSFWPVSYVTLDVHANLMTVDGGVTAHIPFAGEWSGVRHAVLISAAAGYVHSLVGSPWLNYRGFRTKGQVGYGLTSGLWDFRALGGISIEQSGIGAWGYVGTGMLMLARLF